MIINIGLKILGGRGDVHVIVNYNICKVVVVDDEI
jgi:hypothetical protein